MLAATILNAPLAASLAATILNAAQAKPALNHEMVRAVFTERQTSDCEVRCRITFSFQWKFHVYGPQ